MPTLTNYQTHKINAYAVITIGSKRIELEITRFNYTFAKDSIPTGGVEIQLGRNVKTGNVAILHQIVSQLMITLPIQIFLKVQLGPNSYGFQFESWPNDYFMVFSGRITSTGYVRSRDNVSFHIGIAHWLSDLNDSSSLTRSSHTLTPQQMSNLAATRLGQGIGNFFAIDGTTEFFTIDNIDNDLWGLALGPWLQSLTQLDILSEIDDDELGHNIEGLAALMRFEPFIYATEDLPEGLYLFGEKLALPINTQVGADSIAAAISEDIGMETFESFRDSTLWNKLLAYKASYEYSVIPMVNSALIVPQTDGRRTPWQTIFGEEYSSIDVRSSPSRPVKGVRIFTGVGSTTGAVGFNGPAMASIPQQLSGRYDNPDFPDGMIRYENAPRWSSNLVMPNLFAPGAAGPFGPRGNAFFPRAGAGPGRDIAQMINGVETIWDAYARIVYIREALRGRNGVLQGKLRFDIGPGSTVMIRCVEDKFVQQQLGVTGAKLFAEVMAVGISVDAESMSASTTFQLANVRTLAENERDSTSIAKHPLYDNPWRGAPLVDDPIFIPQPSLVFI